MENKLFSIMLREGVNIPPEEREKVLSDLKTAVEQDKVMVIENKGEPIGFLTYVDKGKILINYCLIYKAFRDRFSLLELRHYFRGKFKDTKFIWKSKKRNRMCFVK